MNPSRPAVRQPATSNLRVSRRRPFCKEVDAPIEPPVRRRQRNPSKSSRQAPLFPSKGRGRDDRTRQNGDPTENAKERWTRTGLRTTTTTIRDDYEREDGKASTSRAPSEIENREVDPSRKREFVRVASSWVESSPAHSSGVD
ncbi:MAG: hypothetical protein M1815_003290 [Lichina confinis]|nr:MAG: hypothetical protein M1815_003290 [Lichina confinis]